MAATCFDLISDIYTEGMLIAKGDICVVPMKCWNPRVQTFTHSIVYFLHRNSGITVFCSIFANIVAWISFFNGNHVYVKLISLVLISLPILMLLFTALSFSSWASAIYVVSVPLFLMSLLVNILDREGLLR